jgi:uncharacterized membrane protein
MKHFSNVRLRHPILIALILLSLIGRWTYINTSVYWYDEAFTSLRAAGYTEAQAVTASSAPKLVTAGELYTFQQPAPDATIQQTLVSLSEEDPQHPPLYYALAHYWMRGFGSSITAMRSLGILISLLAVPCMYWFSWELFQQSRIAWIAATLVAVSPMQLLYAHEAREYSLWAVTILFSSASLLRALRLPTLGNWALYTLSLTAALNTFPLSLAMMLGHGLYVFAHYGLRFSRIVRQYCFASGAGLLTFVPWLWVMITRFDRLQSSTSWTGLVQGRLNLIKQWVSIFGRTFVETQLPVFKTEWGNLDRYCHWLVVLIVGVAIYNLITQQKRQMSAGLMVLCLTGVSFGILAVPDLVLDGRRSLISRYLVPSLLGIQIIVAYWLGDPIEHPVQWLKQRRLSELKEVLLGALLVGGLVSMLRLLPTESSWVKTTLGYQLEVAAVVNAAPNPVVISDAEMGDLLSLSHYLKPQIQLRLRPGCWTCDLNELEKQIPFTPEIPASFDTVFFYRPYPPQEWLQAFKGKALGQWKPILDEAKGLWQRSQ